MVQREDAEHADDDRGQHDLHDGQVLEQQLADEDVEFADAAFLQQEAEDEAEEDRADKLRAAHRAGCGGSLDSFTALPGSIIATV